MEASDHPGQGKPDDKRNSKLGDCHAEIAQAIYAEGRALKFLGNQSVTVAIDVAKFAPAIPVRQTREAAPQ